MSTDESNTSSGSPSELIVKAAWRRLWKQGTPYYLPHVIAKGISKHGHDVKPLSPLAVKDVGPLDLINLDGATLSVGMHDNQLTGLDNIVNGGISYDDEHQTFVAEIDANGDLVFSGNYQVYTSSKAMACAIDAAHSILSIGEAEATEMEEGDGHKSDLDVARDYRSKLLQSENGKTLVSTYYDNNEAMSLMFESNKGPAKKWQKYWKGTSGSKQLMKQTSKACRNPNDSDHTVGGPIFGTKSLAISAGLLKQTQRMMEKTDKYKGDPKFKKLANDIAEFKGVAKKHDEEQTAGKVMKAVKNDPKNVREQLETGTLDTTFDDEHVERAESALSKIDVTEDDSEGKGYKTRARGRFEDTVSFKCLRVKGAVKPSGDDPNVSLKSIQLVNPSISIDLHPPSSGSDTYYEKASEAIANSDFVRDLIIRHVRKKINSDETRSYLSNRINDSIQKIFGDA